MKYRFIKGWGNTHGVLAIESSTGLARGNGQSYGDSSLHTHISSQTNNAPILLDEKSGILRVGSGATLGEILSLVLPKGWILPVIPGSSLVTLGGAIAADVHGKNHVKRGSFSQHLQSIKLDIKGCTHQVFPQDDLFKATCGGMGLTGTILEANIQLQKLKYTGWSKQETAVESLEELVEKLQLSQAEYVNAWIDSMKLNRGVLTEIDQGPLPTTPFKIQHPSLAWSFDSWNGVSQKLFNTAYFYHKKFTGKSTSANLSQGLFPLERVISWNHLCGEQGLIQLHFIVPEGHQCLTILRSLGNSSERPLLVSLKKFGPANASPFSFAMKGIGAALDFKNTAEARALIHQLTDAILNFGGRVYLAKDSLLTETQFKQMYPKWQDLQQIRSNFGALGIYRSQQSKRLGLD